MTIIDVYSEKNFYKFKIIGHANYSQKGSDIVCSAISILSYTLAEKVLIEEEKGNVYNCDILFNSGISEISFECVPGNEEYINGVIDTVMVGFKLLENKYPDNVSIA